MKLMTWNCARGFDKKKSFFFLNTPDIAVVQECSKKSTETLLFDEYGAEWVGENLNIGMGVFYKKDRWNVRRLEQSTHGIQWVVPFEVTGPENFTLIAVWACQIPGNKRDSYVGQINRAIKEHAEWFEGGPVVVAGDFNSNALWDKERRDWNHSTVVTELKSRGLASVYHAMTGKQHGNKEAPTFYLQKNEEKKFHIDYVFAPDSWQQRLHITIGDFSEWKKHSDHCPLTVTLSSSQDFLNENA